MIVEANKIKQATESELFRRWLGLGLDTIYSFPEYISKLKQLGVVVIEDK